MLAGSLALFARVDLRLHLLDCDRVLLLWGVQLWALVGGEAKAQEICGEIASLCDVSTGFL